MDNKKTENKVSAAKNAFLIEDEWRQWLLQWPDGLIALGESGDVIWLSEKANEIIGWSLSAVEYKNVHDVLCIPVREFEHEACDCPLILVDEASSNTMNSTCWLDGSGEYISVDYRIIPILGNGLTHHLITFSENRQLQHNVAELEKFACFVDKNPAAIAEFDREGQMLFGNPAMQELLLGYGFDEQGRAKIFPPDLANICLRCCTQGQSITHVEIEAHSSWFSWHFHPLEEMDETTAIGYAFNATEQKQAQAHARITRAEARRDFYAKMMHELRTPLNAIVGYSDLILCRSAESLEEADTSALRGIKVAGLQLNELISDTLDISKIEAGKMTVELESFEMSSVVNDIHEQMSYLSEVNRLEYNVSYEEEMRVRSDKRKVRQILVNLVSNAIKYTKTGSVTVGLSIGSKGDTFIMRVADTGVGIPEEQISSLFQEYSQVRESQNRGIQGTGLGLALVDELVVVLEGSIDVQSTYGMGSTFTVVLPIAQSTECF
ncbi:PAS domain-containing sensor histidine kinase [Teredinibacter haidensis]|uniref:PAS domain-containing sensor histidine kinase n=1 Tax=Teredinibacter haidensis TaxID=2731755 RepID=UPI0009FB0508|nr:ATP-binding protein [Teredinibacter haidensis]